MSAEQKKTRAYLARQRKQLQRDIQRRTLAEFRRALGELSTKRKVALRTVRTLCKRGKARARAAAAELRQRELARIREEVGAIRRAACTECKHRRQRIESSTRSARDKLHAQEREQRSLQRQLEAVERKRTVRERTARSALERRRESDDEVLRNIGAELAPVWRQMRGRFEQAPRNKSRTEAFLEWAAENPDEVLALQAARGESLAAKDIAELHRVERGMRKAGKRGRYSIEELQALRRLGIDPLSPPSGDVPF